ncbi:MAG: ketopantoate reductase family protein [Candidatus Aminicenantes bacterium]|nr:ketopantoate reductase family protein [Candidatus Aminicenantes bacterium]MDH5386393.1 ketopantoate reductase family protein [Candidatus Aminicenantes bacterium]MDH5743757.1 ketopantoate reductase family protein [Candidatus Aminicenantes bacterium]
MPKHHIAIIGAGPVGSIMAAHLARNQENIFLVDIKEELISAIEKNGITVRRKAGEFNVRLKGTGYFTASLSRFHPDLIFIVVKANYLDPLLEEIKMIYKKGQKILVVQNGIDNEDRVAEKFGPHAVMRFVINYAGMMMEPGIVKMSFFHPPNYIGVLSPENEDLANEIAGTITEAGLETHYVPDIKKYEWKKTILNAALMPVCATTGLTMKEAMTTGETRYLCEQILNECIKVAKKLGYEYGEDFFESSLAYLSGAGHHKPSTSLDLEAGNPIEYIFQPIIDYGKKVGSPTPYLESLTKVMQTLENQIRKKA